MAVIAAAEMLAFAGLLAVSTTAAVAVEAGTLGGAAVLTLDP